MQSIIIIIIHIAIAIVIVCSSRNSIGIGIMKIIMHVARLSSLSLSMALYVIMMFEVRPFCICALHMIQ